MRTRTIICWIMLSAAWFTTVSAEDDGGQAGDFLRYGVGGRTFGMGRAYVAATSDVHSVVLNPADMAGASRAELASMYTNLFFDSRFAYTGFIIPRPAESVRNPFLGYLLGPNASIGFSWMGLGMTGFEQRSATGEWLGRFGYSEDAFFTAWAREETGSWGLFRYGLNVKAVHQNYPGLLDMPDSQGPSGGGEWSWGMDAGVSFQPIHAPVLRVFSLRYLVPLRIGFAVQNAVQPEWKTSSTPDRFPRLVRGGFSYRWVLKDWIPPSWSTVRAWIGNGQVLTALDWEWMRNRSAGTFFGVEGIFPVSDRGICVFPRFGINSAHEGPAFGGGISLPFSKSVQMRIDYAYGFHPDLPNDSRFSLSLRMGRDRGIGFFKKQADSPDMGESSRRSWLLKLVAAYPETDSHIAARRLASMEKDSVHIRRYYDLIGGIELANCLFRDAKFLLAQVKTKESREKAMDAVREYTALFNEREDNPLSDADIMNYGEALIIAGRPADAVRVLEEITEPGLRNHYLSGVAEKELGRWDQAIVSFKNAVNKGAEAARDQMSESALNPQNMVALSYLGIGESLILKKDYTEAWNWFDRLIQEFPDSLQPDYPRYPSFADKNIVDDAQMLKGICRLLLKDYEDGLVSLLETERFYSRFEYGQWAVQNSAAIVGILEQKDWSAAVSLADDLWNRYRQNR
jgi:tetratricopeptide (TPR) repeat protein